MAAAVGGQKHPREVTVERTVNARGTRVYPDDLQNLPGKTLAAAYSVRANERAGVSAPDSLAGVEPRNSPGRVHDRHDEGASREERECMGGTS